MFEQIQRAPVIVGVGEIIDRPGDPRLSKEPLGLMAEALRRADEDGGGGWLRRLESLDVVNSVSWGYDNLPAQLCHALDIHPKRVAYGVMGGDTPVGYLHEAAIRIARGDADVAAVCGAEATYALIHAKDANVELPWTPEGPKPEPPRREGVIHPVAIRHGLTKPLVVYPIYEYASCSSWGKSQDEAQAESAQLWSQFSLVAVDNPTAWLRRYFPPLEISTPSRDNRRVAGPYTKFMVANPIVNQGAAILLASLSCAKTMGLPEHRLAHVWGGSAASEPADFVSRDQYGHSSAMEVVLRAAQELARKNDADFEAAEFYSCFPCVSKMARRTLDWPPTKVATVTGGLTFFGGPYNNYMTHAAAAMVRCVREHRIAAGLLYGQGGFVTKHHAVVLAAQPPATAISSEYQVQTEADRRRGRVPRLDENFIGAARVETYTIIYDRHGDAEYAVVFARAANGSRVLARVEREDADTLAFLTDSSQKIIGTTGATRQGSEGKLRWVI